VNPARTVAVFTGNRSEYGLQFPVLRAVDAHPALDYRLIAGGAHLDEDFGATLEEIREDGFEVHAQVDVVTHQDTLAGTSQAIGSGILSVCQALSRLRPDWLLAYGDRYESFAAVIAATQMGIATAHVEGGDYTDGGALDDSVRHAMTKLAHLHFTTNTDATERVLRLGEEPWRVHTVGLPSLDLVASGDFAGADEVLEDLGLTADRPIHLFCQHSVATEADDAVVQLVPSLEALERLTADGHQVIVTYPNNDAGGRRMVVEIERLRGKTGFVVEKSLGRRRFLGLLDVIGRHARGAFIGNSSAGIKETPAFGCPVVNIGSRQHGRLRGNNVLDVPYDADAIEAAALRCVDDDAFRGGCRVGGDPYGKGDAGPRIAETLAVTPVDQRLLQKRMTY
jgi:UDP-hydrolysing UDP-N-acetyl-D-glucosamine 2-epimerase